MGVPPATLARMYVRSKLSDDEATSRRRREGIAALDRLAMLAGDLPQIDAVDIARESRDELNDRPKL
jgi:hypothetical protein